MPLHYKEPMSEEAVKKLCEELGEFITVTVDSKKYKVQRHFIALHGVVAADIENLVAQGIVERL